MIATITETALPGTTATITKLCQNTRLHSSSPFGVDFKVTNQRHAGIEFPRNWSQENGANVLRIASALKTSVKETKGEPDGSPFC
jgi:hypothetical protein